MVISKLQMFAKMCQMLAVVQHYFYIAAYCFVLFEAFHIFLAYVYGMIEGKKKIMMAISWCKYSRNHMKYQLILNINSIYPILMQYGIMK